MHIKTYFGMYFFKNIFIKSYFGMYFGERAHGIPWGGGMGSHEGAHGIPGTVWGRDLEDPQGAVWGRELCATP